MNKYSTQEVELFNRMVKEKPDLSDGWRKHIIKTAVKYFIALYPEQLEANRKRVGYLKETLHDKKYGKAKDTATDLRAIFNIPTHLDLMIRNLITYFLPDEPGFMESEEDNWFIKAYPQFRIANKI